MKAARRPSALKPGQPGEQGDRPREGRQARGRDRHTPLEINPSPGRFLEYKRGYFKSTGNRVFLPFPWSHPTSVFRGRFSLSSSSGRSEGSLVHTTGNIFTPVCTGHLAHGSATFFTSLRAV
jgi:hypothetical protein